MRGGQPVGACELRPMREADLPVVLAIECDVIPFPWRESHFRDSLTSGHGAWVGCVGGEIVGYFVWMMVVDEAHLLTIGVAAPRQRSGIGACLLRQAMRSARAAGAQSLLLEVRRSNGPALAFYRRFGFQEIGVRRAYYEAAGGREDALVMRRTIEDDETC